MPTSYYKEKNMIFRLKNLDVKEKFQIWKKWDKKYESVKDSAGNEMKFPITQGQLTSATGQIRDVKDVQFMKGAEFDAEYPLYARKTSYLRQIYVGSMEYYYSFTKTSNDKLNEILETIKGMGKDAMGVEWQQEYHPSNPAANKYVIKAVRYDLVPVAVNPNAQPVIVQGNAVGIVIPQQYSQPQQPQLNDVERQVLEAIKTRVGMHLDENAFVGICTSNGIAEARGKEIFQKNYK